MLSRTVLCGCGGGISGQEGKEEYSAELSSLPKGPKKSKRYSTLEDLFRPPPPTVLILFLVLLLPCLTAASSISAAAAAAGTSDDEGGGPESGGEGGKHHFPDGGGEQQQPPVAPPEPGKDGEDEGKEGEDTAATGNGVPAPTSVENFGDKEEDQEGGPSMVHSVVSRRDGSLLTPDKMEAWPRKRRQRKKKNKLLSRKDLVLAKYARMKMREALEAEANLLKGWGGQKKKSVRTLRAKLLAQRNKKKKKKIQRERSRKKTLGENYSYDYGSGDYESEYQEEDEDDYFFEDEEEGDKGVGGEKLPLPPVVKAQGPAAVLNLPPARIQAPFRVLRGKRPQLYQSAEDGSDVLLQQQQQQQLRRKRRRRLYRLYRDDFSHPSLSVAPPRKVPLRAMMGFPAAGAAKQPFEPSPPDPFADPDSYPPLQRESTRGGGGGGGGPQLQSPLLPPDYADYLNTDEIVDHYRKVFDHRVNEDDERTGAGAGGYREGRLNTAPRFRLKQQQQQLEQQQRQRRPRPGNLRWQKRPSRTSSSPNWDFLHTSVQEYFHQGEEGSGRPSKARSIGPFPGLERDRLTSTGFGLGGGDPLDEGGIGDTFNYAENDLGGGGGDPGLLQPMYRYQDLPLGREGGSGLGGGDSGSDGPFPKLFGNDEPGEDEHNLLRSNLLLSHDPLSTHHHSGDPLDVTPFADDVAALQQDGGGLHHHDDFHRENYPHLHDPLARNPLLHQENHHHHQANAFGPHSPDFDDEDVFREGERPPHQYPNTVEDDYPIEQQQQGPHSDFQHFNNLQQEQAGREKDCRNRPGYHHHEEEEQQQHQGPLHDHQALFPGLVRRKTAATPSPLGLGLRGRQGGGYHPFSPLLGTKQRFATGMMLHSAESSAEAEEKTYRKYGTSLSLTPVNKFQVSSYKKGDSSGVEFGYDIDVHHRRPRLGGGSGGGGISYQKRRGFDKTGSLLGYHHHPSAGGTSSASHPGSHQFP